METGSTVAAALAEVKARIAEAAVRAGRRTEEISLLAVSKTMPADRIKEAVAAGQTLFGENRVQEAREKIPLVGPGIVWHMIGNLQKNKVKAAVDLFDVVESVDSPELAGLLDKRAGEMGKRLKVFIQVKEADEASKRGIRPDDAPPLIERIAALPNLELGGLMAIPPWPENPEDSRPYFARLRKQRELWDGRYCPKGTLKDLSMGMTADFEVAVEEGATIVRVGSAVFGARSYG